MRLQLITAARELVANCGCEGGCPCCVGPAGETGEGAKKAALAMLERILEVPF